MENRLREHALSILPILRGNGLDAGPLRAALDDCAEFRLAVPFIGAMNSGKSSLLNALAGLPLLPVGITATTAVPTGLVFGENGAFAQRGGALLPIGLGDLRAGIDLAGVTMLRASCALPFFAALPRLCLIDTPGLGAGTLESERALRESLPDPCACLLVFAADDPVVRESEAAFLRELSLRGAPFHPVLTKCDKLLPAEREQAAAYLRESLADLTGTAPEAVACVSARGDVEPVRELLRGLQSRAARLAENRLRQALLLAANQLREYLRMRRDAAGLTVPESARQIELLEERSRLLAGPLEEQARKLEQQAGDWERSLAARLAGTVERAAPSMEAMLLCEQNPASYVDDTLRAAALDSLRRELEPALRGYQKSVNALLRLQGVASGPDAAARCAVSPSWGGLAGFPDSDGLFAEILALLRGVPRGRRRESLRVMLPVRVLPKLSERALAFTAREGGTALEAVRQAAGKAVREQSLLRRAALEELERRGEPNAAEQTRLLREIRAQAQAADAALSACCRKDEEDAYGTDL